MKRKDALKGKCDTRVLIDTIAAYSPNGDGSIKFLLRSGERITLNFKGNSVVRTALGILDDHFNVLDTGI